MDLTAVCVSARPRICVTLNSVHYSCLSVCRSGRPSSTNRGFPQWQVTLRSSSKMADPHLKTGGEDIASVRFVAEKVDPSCLDVFKQLKVRRKHRWITFKINEENTIIVDQIGDRADGIEQVKNALPATDCRWCIYDYEYETADGRKPSKLFFLSWNPTSARAYLKMAYTTGKPLLRDNMQGVFDVLAQSAAEIEPAFGLDVEESDESDIDI